MDPNGLMLTQDEFNAYVLRGVMAATGLPGETPRDGQMRCASIVEVFRTFEALDPMEAWIACHCISLRYMLEAAMRDAGDAAAGPALAIRLRASALAIGKSLHLWMTSFAGMHARNLARAAEAQQQPVQPDPAAKPAERQSAAPPRAPAMPEQPRPIAAQPVNTPPPFAAAPAGPARPAWDPADLPSQSMKQGLLSSAAVSQAAASNGRLAATASPPGR